MKRIINIAILLLTVMVAQAATFTVEAPRQVVEGNKFNVTFVLNNGEGSNFSPPEVSGAKLIYGPSVSHSYSSSWVNGKSSSSSSEEYTMIYKATTTGKCHVGAASIVVGGKRMATKAFSIDVLPSGSHASQRSQQQTTPGAPTPYSDPMTQSADKAVSGKDLFVRIEMSKPRVYEQQAVVCTIKLYTKYQISQFMPTIQPSFDGFLIEEIPVQPSLNKVETLNGERYMTAILKQCILYPQQSGKLTITSGNYDVSVVQFDTFRSIFGTISNPVEKNLRVTSNKATVNILPLPEPKPASFTGAVGRFNVTTDLKPATGLKSYSAAIYRYVISGTGNIKYIKAPDVKFPKEFDTYDPQNKINTSAEGNDVRGTVTFTYQFIPQYVGKFKIPASDFVYFNPGTGRYETIHVPELTLDVAKGAGKPSSHYKKMQDMMTDINALHKGDLNVSRQHSYYIAQPGYWLWFLVPALLLATVVVYCRKLLRERADVKLMRTKRASKLAQKRLKRAKKYMAASDANAFYAEVLNATWGYLGDKLTIPVSELSKDNIDSELEKYGVDADLRTATLELLDKCEFAQYAPQLASGDLKTVFDQAASLMDRLESVKRKKNIAQS